MRVLVVHNQYQYRGGEDNVAESEIELLRSYGHQVATLFRHNDELKDLSSIAVAGQSFWSQKTVRDVTQLLTRERPAVVHVHNTFPLVSPSLYWACAKAGVPVVQTLHNFRLMCPQAMLLRDGKVCESCLGGLPWHAVRHGCYRGSKSQSAVLAGVVSLHRAMGTWDTKITRYIALNEFCRQKFISGGLPAARIVVKPNFVPDPGERSGARSGALFVGRLSSEKGLPVLLEALKLLPQMQCAIAGTGPQMSALQQAYPMTDRLRWLGGLSGEQVLAQMAVSSFLVIPSLWYENFPRTLVEAYANGLPVIASRIGALAELVDEGHTGLLFRPGDSADLMRCLVWANQNPKQIAQMGANARARYLERYTSQRNYEELVDIYHDAMAECSLSVQ